MRKFKNIGIALIAILGILSSCDDDGGDSAISITEGVVPNVQKKENSAGFINLIDLQAGEEIVIDFSVDIAQGSAVQTDVIAFYYIANPEEGQADVLKEVLFENIELGQSFSLTNNEIVAAFEGLNSVDDFQLGDILSITARHTQSNGTVLNIYNDDGTANVGTNILTVPLFNVVTNYVVSCPSELEGSYTFTSTGGASTDGGPTPDENPLVDYTYDVVLTAEGGGVYKISDGFFGVYLLWYDIYGIGAETESVALTDVCGELSGSFGEPFGTDVVYTGTVNDDGTINIKWVNGFDDFAEGVLTPN